jgi:hypothetical protein
MIRYAVWSTLVGPKPERDSTEPPVPAVDQLEVTRTDRRVAEDDRNLIADVLHRKAWLQETEK